MRGGDVAQLFPLVADEKKLGLFDQLHDRLVRLPERPEILQTWRHHNNDVNTYIDIINKSTLKS